MCALNRVFTCPLSSVRRNSLVWTSPGRAVIRIEVSVAVKLVADTAEHDARTSPHTTTTRRRFFMRQVPAGPPGALARAPLKMQL